ncbi:MAG: hypothetical protein NWE91_00600 [Candidatus Bathyarchaeota archaeon]|nr:hypothetical protein [Candidatus Bathyarchaeota archaeon]
MVVELPSKFLKWNFFSRRDSIKAFLEGKHERDMNLFFLESTRHNPALCTAFAEPSGKIHLNAKIVGMGYVLKEEFFSEATNAFNRHAVSADRKFERAQASEEKAKIMEDYQRDGMRLLLEYLYFEPQKAKRKVDFTKMSTIELAKSKPHSSKHTWKIVQQNKTACLLFYRPSNLSFELHGWLDIHQEGLYYEFVNAVHDSFHYIPLEKRRLDRPVYLFNVQEVYNNSPMPQGFGTRIA